MKAKDALVAWTPGTEKIEVGRLLSDDLDWTGPYQRTGGAAYVARRSMTGYEAAMMVFIEFHTIVVRDRVPVQAAHQAFLAIDEYRERISPDITGAD